METQIKPSREQEQIIHAPLRGITKIKAYAGAAKTTTLQMKAEHLANVHRMKGLYIAFNKSAQLEAADKFGDTAVSRTWHSLAYRVFGNRYRHKTDDLRARDLVDHGVVELYPEAFLIVSAIRHFCINEDDKFPPVEAMPTIPSISAARARVLMQLAEEVWAKMCDPTSPFKMPHDGYFKLYQLSRPRLPGDYLMVDEFQDTNPVTLDIIRRQPQPVIVVGDPYQSIYAFRGAVNAMKTYKADSQFSLSSSYRFGPSVAQIANDLLKAHFGETKEIVGAGANTEVYKPGRLPSGEYALLSRTNADLFEHAVEALDKGRSMAFVGGVKGYNFGKLLDVQALAEGRLNSIADPFIRGFQSFTQMQEYAEDADEYDLQRLIKTASTYGTALFELVPSIIANGKTYGQEPTDITLSTAHRIKGATLDHVVLADDFPPLLGKDVPIMEIDSQEVHLMYVAATRAKRSLTVNQAIVDFQDYWSRMRDAELEF